MNPATDNTRPRRPWADYILIAVFVLLLWAPTLDSFFRLDHSRPPGENRLPAPFPEWPRARPGDAQKFLGGLESYFNDHFGFRKKLIRWFQNWKLGLFHDRTVYNVITGRNGWLFTSDLQMVEHYLGMAKFTPAQLKSWQTLLEKRRDWLAQRGIQYLFVIPPDKQTVYPEELPVWLADAAPAGHETKLDQFLKYMQANSTVPILDLRQPLQAAKKIAPTYLQNDTHWNLFGGFVSCQEVIRTLAQRLPGLPALRLEDFQWTNLPATGGDLARMAGSDAVEKNYFEFYPDPGLPAFKIYDATNIVSLWDAHKKSLIAESPAPLAKTAVVFQDSFGLAWQKFLGYDFKKIMFMPDNREFNAAVISENHPDVVINEMLERYFNTLDPEEMRARDALP
jgi:alginate O-acetyltransferase complex protein AlgJ